jgi:diguanylate cyclase (GGDEF)-like protein
MVLGRGAEGDTRVLSIWGLGGVQPSAPWISDSLLGRAFEAPGARIEVEPMAELQDGSNRTSEGSLAVAAPIVGVAGRLGAIYAGFVDKPAVEFEQLCWMADSYARLAALCLDGGSGLAATLTAASVDRLTGCLTHDALLGTLKVEIQRAKRQDHRLSCCFLDLDGFKWINDALGHLEGNRVLAAIGEALREGARPYDAVARFGGDEFVVVLPYAGTTAAREAAERMRSNVAAAFVTAAGVPGTASVGVAEWGPHLSAHDLLSASDLALREAKRTGGARVAVYPSVRRNDGLVELTRRIRRRRSSRAATG